jgi:hypothetical protein
MSRTHRQTALLLLSALAVLIAGYWVVRFGGWYDEGDALRFRFAADSIIAQERIVTEKSIYGNGYAFQVLLAILAVITGSDPASIQIITTFWLVALAIACFMFYRQLLASDWLALLAAVVLLLMPDFLFPILRASHERITWTFAMLIMALWLRNLDAMQPRRAAPRILATYLLFWAMVATNVFLSSTILATFAIALLLLAIAGAVLPQIRSHLPRSNRLLYIPLMGVILIFLFTIYVYPPARSYYYALENVFDRLAVTLLGAEDIATSASFRSVQSGWRSIQAYLSLVILQYGVLAVSFAAWIQLSWRLIRNHAGEVSSTDLVLWLLYFGIGFQLALGLIADFSGALAGNLQVRYMAPFLILAVGMAATWLKGVQLSQLSSRQTRSFGLVALVLVGISVIAALLKVTNDPLVGNYWTFYHPQETRAGLWVDENLSEAIVWLDINTHKLDVLVAEEGYDWEPANSYMVGDSISRSSHFLISDLTRKKAAHYGIALPFFESQNRVYDTGEVQLFHRRPLTPFQR